MCDAFGKMPARRVPTRRANVAGTRVTRRRERRRGRDDALLSPHTVAPTALRLGAQRRTARRVREVPPVPHDASTGVARKPIKEVTARKYETTYAGLLGWMLTLPEEFPQGAKSVRSMRLAFPPAKSSAARAFEHPQWLDAPLRPRARARRARAFVAAAKFLHGDAGEDEARDADRRTRACLSSRSCGAEQGCGSARVPSPLRRTCARSGCRGTSTWGSSSGWKTKSRRGGTRGDENRRGGGVEPAAVSRLRRLVVRAGPATHDPRAGDRAHAVQRTQGGWWHREKRFVAGTKRALHALVTERRRFRGNPRASFAERRGAIDLDRPAHGRDGGGLRLPLGHQARPRGLQNRPKLRRAAADGPRALAVRRLGGVDRAQTRAPGAATRQPVHRANGAPLTDVGVHSLPTSTSYRLTGRRVNPHLVRDMIITHLRARTRPSGSSRRHPHGAPRSPCRRGRRPKEQGGEGGARRPAALQPERPRFGMRRRASHTGVISTKHIHDTRRIITISPLASSPPASAPLVMMAMNSFRRWRRRRRQTRRSSP